MREAIAAYPRTVGLSAFGLIVLILLSTVSSSGPALSSAVAAGGKGQGEGGVMAGLASVFGSSSSSSGGSTSSFSSFVNDPTDTLAYRNHLEKTTSPPAQLTHSPTMTFSAIYVLSLPNRTDRRDRMRKMAKALGFRIEFVDAQSKDAPFLKWIAERAIEVRRLKLSLLAKARHVDPDTIGGLGTNSPWLARAVDSSRGTPRPFPDLPTSLMPDSQDWVSYLERRATQNTLGDLRPQYETFNVTEEMWDPVERIDGRQVNEAVIATYWSHLRVMRRILERGDESALILEDDVDMEWDIERMWSRIHRRLPTDWDMSLLGHCWGHELVQPARLHPALHPSTSPLCLHGYALSNAGAQKLVDLLSDPWTAYQTAVDTVIPTVVNTDLIDAYSIEPPMIIQRKDDRSDIRDESEKDSWRGLLADSTIDRVLQDEGVVDMAEIERMREEMIGRDPATQWQYKCGTPHRSRFA